MGNASLRPMLARSAALAAILGVQAHHRLGRGARDGEEVEDDGSGVVFDEETEGVFDGVEGLWEGEALARQKVSDESRAILCSIMPCDTPLSTWDS